jgi:hypothetical protein
MQYGGSSRKDREANHSHPSGAEVKNSGAISPLLNTSSWSGSQLIKHRNNFTLPQVNAVTVY